MRAPVPPFPPLRGPRRGAGALSYKLRARKSERRWGRRFALAPDRQHVDEGRESAARERYAVEPEPDTKPEEREDCEAEAMATALVMPALCQADGVQTTTRRRSRVVGSGAHLPATRSCRPFDGTASAVIPKCLKRSLLGRMPPPKP